MNNTKEKAIPNNDKPPDKKSSPYRLITIQLLYSTETLDLETASNFIDTITDACNSLNEFGMATITGDIPIADPDTALENLAENEIVFQFLEENKTPLMESLMRKEDFA